MPHAVALLLFVEQHNWHILCAAAILRSIAEDLSRPAPLVFFRFNSNRSRRKQMPQCTIRERASGEGVGGEQEGGGGEPPARSCTQERAQRPEIRADEWHVVDAVTNDGITYAGPAFTDILSRLHNSDPPRQSLCACACACACDGAAATEG